MRMMPSTAENPPHTLCMPCSCQADIMRHRGTRQSPAVVPCGICMVATPGSWYQTQLAALGQPGDPVPWLSQHHKLAQTTTSRTPTAPTGKGGTGGAERRSMGGGAEGLRPKDDLEPCRRPRTRPRRPAPGPPGLVPHQHALRRVVAPDAPKLGRVLRARAPTVRPASRFSGVAASAARADDLCSTKHSCHTPTTRHHTRLRLQVSTGSMPSTSMRHHGANTDRVCVHRRYARACRGCTNERQQRGLPRSALWRCACAPRTSALRTSAELREALGHRLHTHRWARSGHVRPCRRRRA